MQPIEVSFEVVNRAFSAQSPHYDAWEKANPVLQRWRRQIYDHVQNFLATRSHILELNAGTGIDAVYFARQGHRVLATDLSDGMVARIMDKVDSHNLENLKVLQLSYENLRLLSGQKFDYVFSNFGGLNCVNDTSVVSNALRDILNPGGYVTWVVMPPVSLWEISSLLKGRWRTATRRWGRRGTLAHIEGEYFNVYYHSLSKLKKDFHESFQFIKAEGLGALSPPPSSFGFRWRYPRIDGMLTKLDQVVCRGFPFNRWADHIIVTFQFNPPQR